MKLFWKPLIETKGKKSRQNFDEYHLNAPEMELKEVLLKNHNKLDLKKNAVLSRLELVPMP